ncbi:MAG: dihydroneopterin aldolase [Flavobacteriaceae bacterium]|nr:dihydroneopterin aldolase [Flavobacteriaceae bacterium]
MTYTVSLKELKFRARHGVYAFEKEQGNNFVLSISVTFNLPDNHNFDKLEKTYNYQLLAQIAKKHMDTPTDLLETVCQGIAHEIKENNNIVGLEKIVISLAKQNPPIGIECRASEVMLEF